MQQMEIETYDYNRLSSSLSRVQKIISHRLFVTNLESLNDLEAERIWCHHDIEHLLSVARIMWIDNLEQKKGYLKDVIYATGLLHDIGRALEYQEGETHEIAGVRVAEKILNDAGFTQNEQETILEAIGKHRMPPKAGQLNSLSDLLYRADKISRNCYFCKAADTCSWEDKKRTYGVIV